MTKEIVLNVPPTIRGQAANKSELDNDLARGKRGWDPLGMYLMKHRWDWHNHHVQDGLYELSAIEYATGLYLFLDSHFYSTSIPHFYYRHLKAEKFLFTHEQRLEKAGYPLRGGILETMIHEVLSQLEYSQDSRIEGYWRYTFQFTQVIAELIKIEGRYQEQLDAARYLVRRQPQYELFLERELATHPDNELAEPVHYPDHIEVEANIRKLYPALAAKMKEERKKAQNISNARY